MKMLLYSTGIAISLFGLFISTESILKGLPLAGGGFPLAGGGLPLAGGGLPLKLNGDQKQKASNAFLLGLLQSKDEKSDNILKQILKCCDKKDNKCGKKIKESVISCCKRCKCAKVKKCSNWEQARKYINKEVKNKKDQDEFWNCVQKDLNKDNKECSNLVKILFECVKQLLKTLLGSEVKLVNKLLDGVRNLLGLN